MTALPAFTGTLQLAPAEGWHPDTGPSEYASLHPDQFRPPTPPVIPPGAYGPGPVRGKGPHVPVPIEETPTYETPLNLEQVVGSSSRVLRSATGRIVSILTARLGTFIYGEGGTTAVAPPPTATSYPAS